MALVDGALVVAGAVVVTAVPLVVDTGVEDGLVGAAELEGDEDVVVMTTV
jgi:hypothetical protein